MKQPFWSDPTRVYLLLACCNQFNVAFTFGTYVLFLHSLGLDPFEVNLVNVVFYLGRFLFEVPTGVIADTLGHRASCMTAFALYAAGCFMYWCAWSLGSAMFSEFILAVGATCLSGAFSAWIKEQLLSRSFETDPCLRHAVVSLEMHHVTARAASWKQVMSVVAAPLGGLGAWYFGLATPFLMASVGMALTLALAMRLMKRNDAELARKRLRDRLRTARSEMTLPEALRAMRASLRRGLADMIRTARGGFAFARASREVRMFLAVSALATFGLMAPNMQWAPTFSPHLGGTLGASLMFSFIAGILWCGARLAPRLLQAGERTALACALLGVGAGIVLVGATGFPVSLGAFALYELSYGVLSPLREAGVNNAIRPLEGEDPTETRHEQIRATVLSIDEMAGKIAGALGLLITGILAAYAPPGIAWIAGGLSVLAAALVAWRSK